MFYENDSESKPDEKQVAHTPGPWTIRDHRHDEECLYIEGANEGIATVFTDAHVFEAAAFANARLIAAAPDLLEAAKSVIADFEAMKTYQHEQLIFGQTLESASRNWETMDHKTINLESLIKAITKAEGR